MPDPPDIEERIEQIIQAHRPKRLRQRETEECQQGCLYISGGWYVHLSSVLVSELGLTREDADHRRSTVCRYVTEWSDE